MEVATVTTSDRSLLHAVRAALTSADEAFLCVAFVQEKGIHLVEKELESLRRRKARSRLLVTTTFQTTSASALSMASALGLEVRILNPGAGRTFHPKLYLGCSRAGASAVIGSANLTGGLATNFEAAVALRGSREDVPLARAWEWAEVLWADERVVPWTPQVSEPVEEEFDPELYRALVVEIARNPVFMTLGRSPRPNRVVDWSRVGVQVETERSRGRGRGTEEIPAWMFNLAWDRLRTHGQLSNTVLLNDLRVHRSSAVCAMLARVPGVELGSALPIVLRWNPAGAPRRKSGAA